MAKLLVLYFIIKGWLYNFSTANPTGCTYDTFTKEYSCSYRYWTLPLVYNDFSNTVQVLKLTEINGDLPASSPKTFDGFASINTASFDPTIDPRLEIICYEAGSIILSAGTFADMGWVKDLRIKDCRILNLPDNVFQDIGDVNFFSIEGGNLANSVGYNAMNGLNVHRMNVPEPKGTVSIRNVRFISGSLQNGFLYPFANASRVELENINLRSPTGDMFYALSKAIYISLANNPFYELSEKTFEKTTSLLQLNLTGIPWTCSCSKIWPYQWAETNNVSLHGGFVCDYPEEVRNMRGKDYYKSYKCQESKPCGDLIGIKLSDTYCLLMTDIILYFLTLISFLLALIGFSIACHSWRQLPSKPKQPNNQTNQKKPLGVNSKSTKGAPIGKQQTTKLPPKSKRAVSQEDIGATIPPKKFDDDDLQIHPPKPDFRQRQQHRPQPQQNKQQQQQQQQMQQQRPKQRQQVTTEKRPRQNPQRQTRGNEVPQDTTSQATETNKKPVSRVSIDEPRQQTGTYQNEEYDPRTLEDPPSYRSGPLLDFEDYNNSQDYYRIYDPRGLPPPYRFHPNDGFI